MNTTPITEDNKSAFNHVVTHPLQSYEWGVFRKHSGIDVLRVGFGSEKKLESGLTLTIHPIPHTPWTIGYVPKSTMATKDIVSELYRLGREKKCIFIQLEPNVTSSETKTKEMYANGLIKAAHPLFTKYTFVLDLTPSEEELLKNMHSKTRYNIKVAQKHNIFVEEDNSDAAFETYLKLVWETTKRQGFYAHTETYHRKLWETLKPKNHEQRTMNNELTAHLFLAKYQPETSNLKPLTLTAWMLFVFQDTLYYPYGASSRLHRETMSSNLMMWEAIKFGKKLGLSKFDMWGALGPMPDTKDPWYGFHRFKEGYGAKLTEFVGSFDLVLNPVLYQGYKLADKIRWTLLRFRS